MAQPPKEPDTNTTYVYNSTVLVEAFTVACTFNDPDRPYCPRCGKKKSVEHRQNNTAACLSKCWLCNKDSHQGTYCPQITTRYKGVLGESYLAVHWPEYRNPTPIWELKEIRTQAMQQWQQAKNVREERPRQEHEDRQTRDDLRAPATSKRTEQHDYPARASSGYSHNGHDLDYQPGYGRSDIAPPPPRQPLPPPPGNYGYGPPRPHHEDYGPPPHPRREDYGSYGGYGGYDPRSNQYQHGYQHQHPWDNQSGYPVDDYRSGGSSSYPPQHSASGSQASAQHRGRRDRSASPKEKPSNSRVRSPKPRRQRKDRYPYGSLAEAPEVLDNPFVKAVQTMKKDRNKQKEEYAAYQKAITSPDKKEDVDMAGNTTAGQLREAATNEIKKLSTEVQQRNEEISQLEEQLFTLQSQHKELEVRFQRLTSDARDSDERADQACNGHAIAEEQTRALQKQMSVLEQTGRHLQFENDFMQKYLRDKALSADFVQVYEQYVQNQGNADRLPSEPSSQQGGQKVASDTAEEAAGIELPESPKSPAPDPTPAPSQPRKGFMAGTNTQR